MIRLLAVDIDGTLLDSRGQIPEAHRSALTDASALGIEIALVTGRSAHFTMPVASALPVPVIQIVNNGAVVKDAGGITRLRHLLPRDVARDILDRTSGFEDSVALIFDRQPADDGRQIVFERMDWTHPHRQGYYERNKAFIASTASLAEALTEDPIQVMFNGGVAQMRRLMSGLKALPTASRFTVTATEYEARDFSLIDVNAPGCSKGSALARWSELHQLTRGEVMAVGDNLNDVEMLEFAGTAVVMGNACEPLLRRLRAQGNRPRWQLTRTNDEGGLADAIRAFALDHGSQD